MIFIRKTVILIERYKWRQINGENIMFFHGKNKQYEDLTFFKLTYNSDAIPIKTLFLEPQRFIEKNEKENIKDI